MQKIFYSGSSLIVRSDEDTKSINIISWSAIYTNLNVKHFFNIDILELAKVLQF